MFKLIVWIFAWKRRLNQKVVFLELIPPAFTDRPAQSNEQLFQAFHGLGMNWNWLAQLLKKDSLYGLEIVSTRAEGIRFVVGVIPDKVSSIEQAFHAHLPEVNVSKAKDYLDSINLDNAKVIEFKQVGHWAYPLQSHDQLESNDPASYLTNAMTHLEPGELMSLQYVIKPVNVTEADSLRNKILDNEDLAPQLGKSRTNYLSKITWVINKFFFLIMDMIGEITNGQSKSSYTSSQRDLEYKKQVAKHIRPVRTLSYFEHELVESIHNKLAQPLYEVNIRLLVASKNKTELNNRYKSINSAFSLFSVPKYQSLKANKVRGGRINQFRIYKFKNRLPSVIHKPAKFSVSEMASLYHFPNSLTAKTENVVKALSKSLPAPISLKNGTKLDVLLGVNKHHDSSTAIGLTASERERHVYIIGGTGNGKTTMLIYGIVQDINNGNGLAVIDPHGDLAETILRHIPEDRIDDVIYMNPNDLTYPIGLNLLELPEGIDGDELLVEKDLVTESTISVMRKIFSDDDSGGHRIEYILRNAIQTALTLEGSTLFTIFDLLNDTKYRKEVVKGLKDKDLQNFWRNELGKAGEFQKVKMAAGITSKIGRFLFSASAKRILEQPKSTIDFDEILSSGKILICNFSKGLLGEDTSTLFGTTVLAKLQMATLRRARLQQTNRRPYYLYVDEFQNFATMAFVQMLSEARKYKLFLTMAEQSTSQQDQQRLVDIILANVGTVICFRSGSPADERYVLPLFTPYIEPGEISNLPAYNFYARIAAVQAQEPLSGQTVLLDNEGSESVAKQVITSSRTNNAIEYKKKSEEAHEMVPAINVKDRRRSTSRKAPMRHENSGAKV